MTGERLSARLKRLKFVLRKEFSWKTNKHLLLSRRRRVILAQSGNLGNVVILLSRRLSLENSHRNDRVVPLGARLKMNTLMLHANIKFATYRFLRCTTVSRFSECKCDICGMYFSHIAFNVINLIVNLAFSYWKRRKFFFPFILNEDFISAIIEKSVKLGKNAAKNVEHDKIR